MRYKLYIYGKRERKAGGRFDNVDGVGSRRDNKGVRVQFITSSQPRERKEKHEAAATTQADRRQTAEREPGSDAP